ncbi:adenylyl-sulfate kinase [Sinorhizobium meliloti]|nr:adenylyl-sulfate kinase [Sinorhizobium meliloti]
MQRNLLRIPQRSAAGVDGQTVKAAKESFGEWIEPMLQSIHRQGYRAPAVRRRAGQITNFTGVDSPFEVPQDPDITLRGAVASSEEMADIIYERVVRTDQVK